MEGLGDAALAAKVEALAREVAVLRDTVAGLTLSLAEALNATALLHRTAGFGLPLPVADLAAAHQRQSRQLGEIERDTAARLLEQIERLIPHDG